MSELTDLMSRPDTDWDTRLALLQGWRGADADQARQLKWGHRLVPGACAAGALTGALLGSPLVLGLFALTALVGAVASNHPFEWIYNDVARRTDRPALPANRAAKRLACAIGVVMLGGAAVLMVAGATVAGTVIAVAFGVTAVFVAVTGICVPSVIFTLLWGAERASAPSLTCAWRHSPAADLTT